MFGITLGGLFVVSALIGVLATGLDNKIQDLRKGRSFVIESDHTLILGWSETVYTILSELAIANESEKNPVVVILSDLDRVEMEDLIRAKVGSTGNTRVVCRSGSAIDLRELAIVNPQGSRSIIVLSPDDEDPDAQVIKTDPRHHAGTGPARASRTTSSPRSRTRRTSRPHGSSAATRRCSWTSRRRSRG